MSDVIIDPDDPTQAIVANATEPVFGIHIGSAVLKNVHQPDKM